MKRGLAALGLAILLAGAVLYGFAAHREHWFPYGPLQRLYQYSTSWRSAKPADRAGVPAAAGSSREEVAKLAQIPYLSGYRPASGKEGVTAYTAGRAYDGWNLCVSAHAPEARLLDMKGHLLHKWSYEARRIWPSVRSDERRFEHDDAWSRAKLLPGGDVVAIWEYVGIARVDPSSRLEWALPNAANHDIALAPGGDIYTLTREIHALPDVNPAGRDVWEDFVTILSPEGQVRKRISVLRSFERSDFAAALAPMANEGDILHTNGIQILDGALAASRGPAFREGNLLLSIRALNLVAVLDPREEKIVWALSGAWRAQHMPRLLDSGRLLVFDNFGRVSAKQSRVIELDPTTQEIAWRYGDREGEGLFSESHGQVQRLPNGNTLIVDSNNGRAIEVTPVREIVWEYVNPFRVGKKKELVATLSQVERLPAGELPEASRPPAPRPKSR